MTWRAGLLVFSLTVVLACDLVALETVRGVVRESADFQCSDGCGTYYVEPDAPYTLTALAGNFRAYLDMHVQVTGYRDLCSGCQVLFSSEPVILLPPLSVDHEDGHLLPREVSLKQNFPNPFNPSTTIEYALEHTARVRLTISDLLGRDVAFLIDGEQPPGVYRARWTPGDVPGGVYICRLRVTYAGQQKVKTSKMLLVR